MSNPFEFSSEHDPLADIADDLYEGYLWGDTDCWNCGRDLTQQTNSQSKAGIVFCGYCGERQEAAGGGRDGRWRVIRC